MERNDKGQFLRRATGEMFEGFPIWYDQKGYPLIHVNGKDIKVHVFVWERQHGTKPHGFDIHHKDHNKGNFDLQNLELLSGSDHRRVHAGWVKQDGKWIAKPCGDCKQILPLDAFYERRTANTPSSRCKECHKKWSNNRIVSKEKLALYNRRWYQKRKRGGDALCPQQ